MAKVHKAIKYAAAASKVHHLKAWKQWRDFRTKGQKELASLQELIEEALEEAQARAEEEFKDKVYEVQKTVDNVKQQLKSMLDSLPPQWAELSEYDLIMARLQSQREKQNQSSFARGSGMVGKQKAEMQLGEVKRWVSRVDGKVGAIAPKLAAIGDDTDDDGSSDTNGGGGKNKQSTGKSDDVDSAATVQNTPQQASAETDPAKLTFHYVCDDVRRKKRRGEPVEPQDVELVADRAFVLLKELRNELAPSWKPEDVPRWLNAGDKYIYDLALASVPKELFEQTNGWDGIQDLRKQQQVFTLRAADQTSESMRRVTAKTDAI
ncbi:MAG: hypothetical protein H7Z43_13935 [Clostridia bacterium]|nr:hypothetical protein [Deltaproteobacteria bacterium]